MSKVKLISTSSPDIIADIAYMARVSNPNNQQNTETSQKLVQYLVKHKHWSPFEMVSITMEINTTRDIAKQILRHRSFSFQEFSQRYADVKDLGVFEFRENAVYKMRQTDKTLFVLQMEIFTINGYSSSVE